MLYLLFLLKWICSIQKVYFDVKKATFFLSATVLLSEFEQLAPVGDRMNVLHYTLPVKGQLTAKNASD